MRDDRTHAVPPGVVRQAARPGGQAGVVDAPPARRRGRPRAEGVDERILDAALALLRRKGYQGLHVDAVAAEAGVAKTTLYRRWPSKEMLVADAVRRLYTEQAVRYDTGDLRSDLVALVRDAYHRSGDGPDGVLEELVRQSAHSRELARVVRATTDARRRPLHEALNRAVARGELSPTVHHELVIDLLFGPLWTRRLVTGSPLADDDIEAIVDLVLDGILAAGRPR